MSDLPWNVYTVLGGAWGDEGKGKITFSLLQKLTNTIITPHTYTNFPSVSNNFNPQLLTDGSLVCVRFNGGSNAGHTNVIKDGEKQLVLKTNQVPSGILVPGVVCVIGPKCVVNYEKMCEEISKLEEIGINDIRKRLLIAHNAHVVTKEHIEMDKNMEAERRKTGNAIGTTCQGIGPCNAGKALRTNKRVEDFPEFNNVGTIINTRKFFENHRSIDLSFVFEGAQSVELDIDWGDYPYVTSSGTYQHEIYSTGLYQNLRSNTTILVFKSYETYVGDKKFQPDDPVFNEIAKIGHEYGTVTKRPRQVNYLDLTRLQSTIYSAKPAKGDVMIVFNKHDVLEEIYKTFGEKAFGVKNIEGNTQNFSSMEEMKSLIVKTCINIGIKPDNVIFTNSPCADVNMWSN